MALSLGVSVGATISVGDSLVKVVAIKNPKQMVVTVNGGSDIKVDDNKAKAVEILPGVRLFVGLGKNGNNSNRLAFEAPKSIPILVLDKRSEGTEPKGEVSITKKTNGADAKSLFLNGVFESTLTPILKNQQASAKQPHYLQPYSSSRILLLANSNPTPTDPITLYLSETTSLDRVSYRAKIVGWQNKEDMDDGALAILNQRIKDSLPSEEQIYREGSDGKRCVNLISIVDLEELKHPFSVSYLIKTSDGKPLKNRTRSGGWAVVREVPEWLGESPRWVKEHVEEQLQSQIFKSSKDSSALRRERLAKAPKLPEVIEVISRAFRRNPDVIAEVLHRANGICERCHAKAPFLRASDDSPYLEVHHRIMLSEGGEDTVENALALCPNCHRRFHFGTMPLANSDEPNATHLDSQQREVLLEVGAEGGSLSIVRQRKQRGPWEYWSLRDETTLLDVLVDDDIENRNELYNESDHMRTFEDALSRLSQYPWFHLYPLRVNAEFADLVLREVEKRGGKEAAVKWLHRSESLRSDD